jgi:hypothetical protein
MKIRPVGAELFRVDRWDRQTDMTKLIVAFHNFAKAPETYIILLLVAIILILNISLN